MGFKQVFKRMIIGFFQYETPKIVQIKDKKVGILNRLIQIIIIAYIIGYIIIYEKGYQEFSGLESAVTTKVKGVVSTEQLSDEDFNDNYANDTYLYKRVWDISDLVVPASENGAFFVTTNVIISPNQTLSTCAEDADVIEAICDPKDKNACIDEVYNLGHGVSTGRCINSSRTGVHTCEIKGWCPIEKDDTPLKNNTPLFSATKNFTVLIKNSIKFSDYNIRRHNILDISNSSYLKTCNYDPDRNAGCPVFVLSDIVKQANVDYDEIARDGAVIGIEINWNCNLDINLKYCVPVYKFRRLDDPNAKIAKGWNFRYANYYGDSRTLFKAIGIRFVLLVNGSAGKFSFIPLVIKIGSGLGLLAITTIICDIVVLYLNKAGKYYKDKKYQYVEQVNGDEYSDCCISDNTSTKRANTNESCNDLTALAE